jgi:hypothetical protein
MDLSNADGMSGENKTCKMCTRGTSCMKDRMIAEVRAPPQNRWWLSKVELRPWHTIAWDATPDPSRGYECAQEGYWRKDSHQEVVYRCRLNLCRGEATALEQLSGHAVDSNEFDYTLSPAERTVPVELNTCRTGAAIRIPMRRTILKERTLQCDC